jgi:hypothetical protein
MEKEFIPYEQALALKELNAYIECFGFYWFNGSSHIWVLETKEYEDEYYKTISAPTFSQAFRWFREKYKIRHVIDEYDLNNYCFSIDDGINDDIEVVGYKSYEEAELECLKKLIEIVKEK